MSDRVRQILLAVVVAYLAFAGYILGRFANAAFPTFYLFRPLLLVIPLALLVGLLAAGFARSHAPLAAGIAVGLICFWATFTRHWWQAALVAAAWLALVLIARRVGRPLPLIPRSASMAAMAFVLVFFVSGVVRARSAPRARSRRSPPPRPPPVRTSTSSCSTATRDGTR